MASPCTSPASPTSSVPRRRLEGTRTAPPCRCCGGSSRSSTDELSRIGVGIVGGLLVGGVAVARGDGATLVEHLGVGRRPPARSVALAALCLHVVAARRREPA